DYSATTGQLVFGPGVRERSFVVPVVNDTAHEGSETVRLTLTDADPATALGAQRTATLTILDNGPVVQFSAATYLAAEHPGSETGKAVVAVQRLGTVAGSVHVDYATSAGTAVPGLDYLDTSGRITFGPGVVVRTFEVKVLGNTSDERKPTVNLTLSAVDIPLGTPGTAVLTLQSDDRAGAVQLGATVFSDFASAESIRITVVRSGGTAGPATVEYTTSDGTAVHGTDYTATSGTLTFGPGETSQVFAVPVAATSAGNRYFTVALGATTGGLALGPRTHAPVWIVE